MRVKYISPDAIRFKEELTKAISLAGMEQAFADYAGKIIMPIRYGGYMRYKKGVPKELRDFIAEFVRSKIAEYNEEMNKKFT